MGSDTVNAMPLSPITGSCRTGDRGGLVGRSQDVEDEVIAAEEDSIEL